MPTLIDLTIAERHRVVAGRFSELVENAADWEVPSPVAGWVARDVVGHLTSWFPGFLASGSGIALPAGDTDPVTAWERQTSAIQEILDDAATASRDFTHRHGAGISVAQAVDQFYTPDVFMHSWDLARATGQRLDLEPDYCAHLLAGMQQVEELMRSSGEYGPAVPVPVDADAATRMVAFIGRDPDWSPSAVPAE